MRIESILTKPTYITEGWNDPRMLLLEQQVIKPWVRDIERYVVEAQLTADQIKQIFAATEKSAVAGGASRTLVGKGVDAAKFIDQKINELGAALKQAGPVQNMDAKFRELKAKISSKDSDVVQGLKDVSDWAKANPGKASIAVAVVTTAAALAGGPFGGLVGGFLARAMKDLLQGADLSTAIGKSFKTGVYGLLAGIAFKYITDNILDNIATASDAELAAMEQGFKDANFESLADMEYAKAGLEVGALDGMEKIKLMGELNAFEYSYDTVMTPAQLSQFNALEAAAEAATKFSPEHYAASARLHDFMIGVQNNPENIKLTGLWNGLKEIPRDMLMDDQIATLLTKFDDSQALIGALGKASETIGATIQAAIQASQSDAKTAVTAKPVDAETKQKLEADAEQNKAAKESYYVQQRPLSEGQIYLMFNKISQHKVMVMEGPMDLLKKGADAVGKAASWVGKQTTEKITSAKLLASWKLEGSPTDSEALAKFLKGQGVSDDIVKQVYADMKLPEPGTAPAAADVDIDAVKQMIAKLSTGRKARLLTYMLGGKKAMKQAAAAPEDDNPNIVRGTESKIPRGQKL